MIAQTTCTATHFIYKPEHSPKEIRFFAHEGFFLFNLLCSPLKEGAAQQLQLAGRGAHRRPILLLRVRHGRLRVSAPDVIQSARHFGVVDVPFIMLSSCIRG